MLIIVHVQGLTVEQNSKLFQTKPEDRRVFISCKLTAAYVCWYQQKDGEALTMILYFSASCSPVHNTDHSDNNDFAGRLTNDNYALKIEECLLCLLGTQAARDKQSAHILYSNCQ